MAVSVLQAGTSGKGCMAPFTFWCHGTRFETQMQNRPNRIYTYTRIFGPCFARPRFCPEPGFLRLPSAVPTFLTACLPIYLPAFLQRLTTVASFPRARLNTADLFPGLPTHLPHINQPLKRNTSISCTTVHTCTHTHTHAR